MLCNTAASCNTYFANDTAGCYHAVLADSYISIKGEFGTRAHTSLGDPSK